MSNTELLGLERQERIAQLLEQRGTLTVAEISESFDVSEATARRDLAALAARNVIRRVHGGAMRVHSVATSEAPILHRQEQNAEVKKRIGLAAARRIQNNETLLLMGGSTGLAVARQLGDHSNLTIVTDSLIVANELLHQGNHRVIMLGGAIDPAEFAVRGTLVRLILSELQVDKVILGTKALSAQRGLSAESAEEAELARAFIHTGHHVIVVADSSKFRQTALVRVVPIDSIDTLITDSGIPAHDLEAFQERGVYVEIV
ncbi:DeoR/GlpR transcriptional regulator, partial [Anaerolineae bacterium CFX9]|jgi:DeoR/GlpR family transcriptional regulator of sugar metabolism|nr:DeoR/GlpR family DNA-binding transcription regulator [Oscillatoria laete-virens]MDI9636010.1 DeoR/GlpR family DNA-binding transcription regulator [Geitlerinema splendidum]MDK3157364.1 DeoR/GlpR family DNA-binding transcription regulator [Kamptonema cortianum]MDL1902724.1 DeoR/GlpR transcriptional regulator [Anaerolineae bacterium CFX9]MDL5054881.1 DeoR/GlpR family DNA-binding transcription regulator [Oscillatoria laete-virens NRMC-F 0139]